MTSAVYKLWKLQKTDLELDQLTEKIHQMQNLQQIQSLMAKVRQLELEQQHIEERLQHFAKQVKNQEYELRKITDIILHNENLLYDGGIANPKELAQIQANIKLNTDKVGLAEETLLKSMESLEGQDDKLQEVRLNLAKNLEQLQNYRQQVQGLLTGFERQVEELNAQKAKVIEGLNGKMLAEYEGQRRKKKGALVALINKDRICQGCYVTVPIHDWQLVRQKRVLKCEGCGRYLMESPE